MARKREEVDYWCGRLWTWRVGEELVDRRKRMMIYIKDHWRGRLLGGLSEH